MRRATITLPDDLEVALDEYRAGQSAPPNLTSVVQAALRDYLVQRGYLREPRRLRLTPAPAGSGHTDVSASHDEHLVDG